MFNKTKKFISTFILITMLLLTLNLNAYGQTSITESDQLAIKNVISEYFKTEIEAIKHKHYDNNVINNDKLQEYQTLYSDYLDQWYNNVGVNLISYNENLKIDSITNTNGKYSVDVTNNTDMVFDIAPEIKQQAIENYNFTLEMIGDKWKITDFKNLSESDFNLDNKINEIKTNTKNIKDIVTKFKPNKLGNTKFKPNRLRNTQLAQPTVVLPLTTPSFDRDEAVDYAEEWWDGYDPSFVSFPEDCTNFVSECWFAAGIDMTDYWYNYGYLDDWTKSWTVVGNFYSYMRNNGWCYSGDESDVQLGDVIQLYNANKHTWTHSMITTYIDYYGDLYYCAHSQPRHDYGLYHVYPSSTYTNARFMCVYDF